MCICAHVAECVDTIRCGEVGLNVSYLGEVANVASNDMLQVGLSF